CFLCIRRSTFAELDGFDPRYAPGYYEDTDLCLQARRHGHRVVYDPSMVIYHYEYASFSSGRPPASSAALMRLKQRDFVLKNQALLTGQPSSSGQSRVSAAFRIVPAGALLRILLIEDRIPAEISGSGFGRTADILHALTESGALVSVW